jgi:glycosyltransferase involved in cell wall biosynthesis
MPLVSVVTATYERAHTLPHLYDSLCAQTFKDFEWVVVDDHSTDGTLELIEAWTAAAPFPIRLVTQGNWGRHIALNTGIEMSRGHYCAIIDSDDWYEPEALERMLAAWESIPPERRDAFANVEGLCVLTDGSTVGSGFPADVFDSNTFTMAVSHGMAGDTKGMYRRDVLAQFPFPNTGERDVTASLVWNRIAARYETRFVNEVWAVNDYQPDGMSTREHELMLSSPSSWRMFWAEYVAMPRPIPPGKRLRGYANYVRHSLHAGAGAGALWRDVPSKLLLLATLPLGVALAVRDRRA